MRLTLRVRPGSSRTDVRLAEDGALVVRVVQRAVDGAATEAALAACAKALGLRTREVVLIHGATSRTKLVEVPDSAEAALKTLTTT